VEAPLNNKPTSPVAATLALLFLGSIAGIIVLILVGALAVLDVGGFCAVGGPYQIRQECPPGTALVLALGVPALFVAGIGYVFSKPASWTAVIGWAWPVLFVGLAVCFFLSAAGAPDGAIVVAPVVVGIMMLAIGIVPVWLVVGGRLDDRNYSFGMALRERPVQLQWAAIILGFGAGWFLWTLIV
jgi:hypothetical protein